MKDTQSSTLRSLETSTCSTSSEDNRKSHGREIRVPLGDVAFVEICDSPIDHFIPLRQEMGSGCLLYSCMDLGCWRSRSIPLSHSTVMRASSRPILAVAVRPIATSRGRTTQVIFRWSVNAVPVHVSVVICSARLRLSRVSGTGLLYTSLKLFLLAEPPLFLQTFLLLRLSLSLLAKDDRLHVRRSLGGSVRALPDHRKFLARYQRARKGDR